jgi:hypothetical protein
MRRRSASRIRTPPHLRISRRITTPLRNTARVPIVATATIAVDKTMAEAIVAAIVAAAGGTVAEVGDAAAVKAAAICHRRNTHRRRESVRTIRADTNRAGMNPAAMSSAVRPEALRIAAPKVRGTHNLRHLRRRAGRKKNLSFFQVNRSRNTAAAQRPLLPQPRRFWKKSVARLKCNPKRHGRKPLLRHPRVQLRVALLVAYRVGCSPKTARRRAHPQALRSLRGPRMTLPRARQSCPQLKRPPTPNRAGRIHP